MGHLDRKFTALCLASRKDGTDIAALRPCPARKVSP